MPAKIVSLSLVANVNDVASPSSVARYFARSQSGEPLQAEDVHVEAILGSLSGYHRGVLSLHYGARVWPEAVTKALHGFATLGIRLYCADHPATGSTPRAYAKAARRCARGRS